MASLSFQLGSSHCFIRFHQHLHEELLGPFYVFLLLPGKYANDGKEALRALHNIFEKAVGDGERKINADSF